MDQKKFLSFSFFLVKLTLTIYTFFYLSLFLSFPNYSRAIIANQDIQWYSPWSNLFVNDFWGTSLTNSGSHKSYRPICTLSFKLNYYFNQYKPWGYHLVNILLHTIVTLLFTNLTIIFFNGELIYSLICGLLFASHPIHTEAVSSIVGRADIGSAFFLLISFHNYLKYCDYRDNQNVHHSFTSPSNSGEYLTHRKQINYHLYLCLLFATLSMFTKEYGITIIPICILYEVTIKAKLINKQALLDIFQNKVC